MRLSVLNSLRTVEPETASEALRFHRELDARIAGEVRFDTASRAAYSTDASNYRRIPKCVVVPRSEDDVVAVLAVCREHGVPIVSRGGGTSLNGQCCTTGVVVDCSKYLNRIVDIDPEARTARVQPGVVLDTLRKRTIADYNLTYGPDPSTHSHCTFGGMLGNNSCGVHSVMAGRSSDNVIEMKVVTSDGQQLVVGATDKDAFQDKVAQGGRTAEIYEGIQRLRDEYADDIRNGFPDIPRRVSGYNLPDLLDENECNVARALVGSEGTCVAILEATVRLVDWPRHRVLLVLGYPSVYEAGDHVPQIMECQPIGLEGLDHKLVEFMRVKGLHPRDIKLLPEGNSWLLVEFGGESENEAESRAREVMNRLSSGIDAPAMELIKEPDRAERIWEVRESGLGATAFVPTMHDTWPGWEDAAVPPDQVGAYLRDFRSLLDETGYDCALYGHFGQGCIHCRIDFDFVTHEGIDRYRSFVQRAAELVVKYGGSLSAEHGDGIAKGELLSKMYGERLLDAFGQFKRLWDPDGIMNPGKIIDAPPVDTDLRLGADYAPAPTPTILHFPDSDHDFARTSLRCVGVGKCRRRDDAFMCPSYMATQEEIHATRGRARLLFEMVRGDFISDAWKSDAVRESLDLCLACKGCKKECPVSVDMASYKAEFLHHYYKRRLRPRSFYAMGHIGIVAALASCAPGLANRLAGSAITGRTAKWLAGVAPQCDLPRFADQTFRQWFKQSGRYQRNRATARALLIPDTFNDHFFPQSLRAAVESLEHLGYHVVLPPRRFPAVRPLIHYGFLPRAKRMLRQVIDDLDLFAAAGIPIIGVEPSTVSVIRDDAQGFFPGSAKVRRVSGQTRLFSEFVATHHLDDLQPIGGRCIFHAHCHQKAVLNPDAARDVLNALGMEIDEPEPGCCGMAGSFGFERGHAQLARQIGESNLLPAVRESADDTYIIIEGFSCREQIRLGAGRTPRHLDEVVRDALERK